MFALLKCINHLGKINYYLSHSNLESIIYLVNSEFVKFQIEEGPHRKIQREGMVCINNID
jgi:hypothetical protein